MQGIGGDWGGWRRERKALACVLFTLLAASSANDKNGCELELVCLRFVYNQFDRIASKAIAASAKIVQIKVGCTGTLQGTSFARFQSEMTPGRPSDAIDGNLANGRR